MLQQPLRVTVGVRNSAATTVKQRLLFVGREAGKLLALRQLLREGLKPPVLVFVASKVCTRLFLPPWRFIFPPIASSSSRP